MFFLSKGLYGVREWNHWDLYEQESRWWFVEFGSHTLEIDLNPQLGEKSFAKDLYRVPTRLLIEAVLRKLAVNPPPTPQRN